MSADMERLAAEFERFQARIKDAEHRFSGVAEKQEQLGYYETEADISAGWSTSLTFPMRRGGGHDAPIDGPR
ncbi:hypothetical protein [Actinokineospora globicatena]|uniref:Uncharacterized protein n=1 Tax=Actinokineospora globicatena TaxID=103729 RepID=A0A9W6QPJ3_9PSEU|nr:hypothetical protein [Actinokineospora globicatena]GLW92324.1 hypothetical protein Aglo03_31400 [Actinokineospora globicatena]